MSHKWISTGLVVLFVCLLSLVCVPLVHAQDETPQDSTCRSCHENRYLLHDSGNWYCLCGKQGECIDCHGGDDTNWNADTAHVDMVINPIEENPAVCQNCHPDNYNARIEEFAAMAGIDPHPTPAPTSTPYPYVYVASSYEPEPPVLFGRHMEPWRVIGLGVVVLFLTGLAGYAVYCWRSDCRARRSIQA